MKLLVLFCASMTWGLGLAATVPPARDERPVPFQCSKYLDVVAVVDGSDSVLPPQFKVLKQSLELFAKRLLSEASERTFGVVVYSAGVTETVEPSGDLEELLPAISKLNRPADGTDTDKGIMGMTDMLLSIDDRTDVPKVGVVITDGMSKNRTLTEEAARIAKDEGINIFAVGVGQAIDKDELYAIASSTNNVMTVDSFEQLYAAIDYFVHEVCRVDGGWGEWFNVSLSQCSETCGDGYKTMRMARRCDNPPPSGGGRKCNGSSSYSELLPCQRECPPVDGEWGPWTEPMESECSVTCGDGEKTAVQFRDCDSPPPSNDGRDCNGSDTLVTSGISCNAGKCPEPTNPCSDCEYDNGVAFFAHPNPLFFYQCVKGFDGPFVKPCAPGTLWSQFNLACIGGDPGTWSVCDELPGEEPIKYLPYSGQTKRYIRCVDGEATYEICPEGSFWNTENPPCTQLTQTETTQEPCRFTAIEDKPTAYLETVEGHEPWQRNCAGGTVFNQDRCKCVTESATTVSSCFEGRRPLVGDVSRYEVFEHGTWKPRPCPPGTTFVMPLCRCEIAAAQPVVKECSPKVKLEFDNFDAKDTSGEWTWVENHKVAFTGGYASFGNESYLRMNRFSNMDFGDTLTIKFLIRRRGNNDSYPQAVVTNADCGAPGSISFFLTETTMVFELVNKEGRTSAVTLPFLGDSGMTRITLFVSGGTMGANVGSRAAAGTPFPGQIAKVHCGIQVGQGTGLNNFLGDLDDFQMYLCNPFENVARNQLRTSELPAR